VQPLTGDSRGFNVGGETQRPFRWLNCCCCRSYASYGMAC